MYELELPSGMRITFRAPKNYDRKQVIDRYVGTDRDKQAQSDVEILASMCLLSQNDQQVMEPDPRRRLDAWELKDVQFYQGVFLEMFFMSDEDDLKKVKEAAKNLLGAATVSS